MRVALATCSAIPEGNPDDHPVAELLGARFEVWDDASVDWASYDRVVLRSVWDYTTRADEFLAWCHAIGPQRLRNRPALIAFNADRSSPTGSAGCRCMRGSTSSATQTATLSCSSSRQLSRICISRQARGGRAVRPRRR